MLKIAAPFGFSLAGFLLVVLAAVGCTFAPGGAGAGAPPEEALDAGVAADALALFDADAAAPPRLRLNQACDPTAEIASGAGLPGDVPLCIDGYTCRPRYDDGSLCRPNGDLPAGAPCAVVEGDECAAGLACVEDDGPGAGGWCRVVCDASTGDTAAACFTAGPGLRCVAWWSETVGWCR